MFFFPICFHIDKSKPLYYNTDSVNVCVLREKHAKPEDHNTFVRSGRDAPHGEAD